MNIMSGALWYSQVVQARLPAAYPCTSSHEFSMHPCKSTNTSHNMGILCGVLLLDLLAADRACEDELDLACFRGTQ